MVDMIDGLLKVLELEQVVNVKMIQNGNNLFWMAFFVLMLAVGVGFGVKLIRRFLRDASEETKEIMKVKIQVFITVFSLAVAFVIGVNLLIAVNGTFAKFILEVNVFHYLTTTSLILGSVTVYRKVSKLFEEIIKEENKQQKEKRKIVGATNRLRRMK